MTVKELQDVLTGVPPDTDIFVEYDGMMEPLSAVRVVSNALALFYDGYGTPPNYKDWTSDIEYAQNELRRKKKRGRKRG